MVALQKSTKPAPKPCYLPLLTPSFQTFLAHRFPELGKISVHFIILNFFFFQRLTILSADFHKLPFASIARDSTSHTLTATRTIIFPFEAVFSFL